LPMRLFAAWALRVMSLQYIIALTYRQ